MVGRAFSREEVAQVKLGILHRPGRLRRIHPAAYPARLFDPVRELWRLVLASKVKSERVIGFFGSSRPPLPSAVFDSLINNEVVVVDRYSTSGKDASSFKGLQDN